MLSCPEREWRCESPLADDEEFQMLFGKDGVFTSFKNKKPDPDPNVRRDLTDDDRLSWDNALSNRTFSKPRNLIEAGERIRLRNPVRWWGMKRDYKWLQKQLKNMGVDPDQARWLL